jgi:hypothetical protein
MPITATGLAALALADAKAALSRCGTVQALLGTTNDDPALAAAATLLRIFIDDAGQVETGNYLLLTCKPRPSEFMAADLRHYVYDIAVECWLGHPGGATAADQDFINSHNLDQAVTELWAQHTSGALAFELESAGTDQPVRDDDAGAQGDQVGNLLSMALGAYNE